MSMKKTLALVAAAGFASMVAAGCATQGSSTSTTTPAQPVAVDQSAPSCKGVSKCKSKKAKHVKKQAAETNTSENSNSPAASTTTANS